MAGKLFDKRALAQGAAGSIIASAVLKLGGVLGGLVLGAASARGIAVAVVVGIGLGLATCGWSVWWTRHSYGAFGTIQYVADGAGMVLVWNTTAVAISSVVAIAVAIVLEGVQHGFFGPATGIAAWHVALASLITWVGVPLGSWVGYRLGFS